MNTPNFKTFVAGINIQPTSPATLSTAGDLQVESGNNNKLYYNDGTISSPLVTEASASSLSNKILIDPVLIDPTVQGPITTGTGEFILNSSGDITVPNGTDTLTGISLTQTLTNKTINASSNTITNITNTNISSSAAIAYSKLNLSDSVLDTDINSGAAINGQVLSANGVGGASWINNPLVTVESANTVLAGPISGGTALPSFRSLVDADLPARLSSSGGQTPISGSVTYTVIGTGVFAAVPGLSCTITCSGTRPVRVELLPDGTSNGFYFATPNSFTPAIQIQRDATTILGTYTMNTSTNTRVIGNCPVIDLSPSSGSHTYTVYAAIDNAESFTITNMKLYAYEL
jgi:hypothetical protein